MCPVLSKKMKKNEICICYEYLKGEPFAVISLKAETFVILALFCESFCQVRN